MKIAICTPCQDQVNAGFALDLAMLVGHAARTLPETEVAVIQNRGTIIPQQRAALVYAAQAFGATHLLWIDSDMRFPKDTLGRLLAHDQAIVAANYPTRRPPILPTAEHTDHGYLFTPDDAEGLSSVTHCGLGFMLVDMSVYGVIREPWFHLGYNRAVHEYAGEDFYFCKRAREEGYDILIDQDLSRQVRHAGEIEWTAAHALVTRDAYQPPAIERSLGLVDAAGTPLHSGNGDGA